MLEGEIMYLNKCDCHYNHNCLQEMGGGGEGGGGRREGGRRKKVGREERKEGQGWKGERDEGEGGDNPSN